VQKHEERKRQRSDNLDGPLPKRKKKEKKATEDSGEKVDPGLNSLLDPSLVNVSSQPAKAPKRGRPKKKPETDLGGNIIPKKPSELSEKTLKRKSSGSGPGTSKKTNSVVPRKFPCMLCPDPSEEGLVRIIEEPSHVPSEPLHTTTPADSPPTTTNVLNPGQDVSLTDGKLVPEPSKGVQPVKHQSSRPKPVKWAHKVRLVSSSSLAGFSLMSSHFRSVVCLPPVRGLRDCRMAKKSSKDSKQLRRLVGLWCVTSIDLNLISFS
jgi:hypothetical protein